MINGKGLHRPTYQHTEEITATAQARTTIIYTNWRRARQLERITHDAMQQSTHPQVWVVDNASDDTRHRYEGIAHRITRLRNQDKCYARWAEAAYTVTEFICIMDDDLTFDDAKVIEDCEQYMDDYPHMQAIGHNGVRLTPGKSYWQARHMPSAHEDQPCDIIKGRFMFVRARELYAIPTRDELNDTCDDICISAMLTHKRVPAFLRDRIINLIEGMEALHASQDQRRKRDRAAAHYFD
jgi:glycosyltransferase involved in cell wall biosynthesis